MKLETVYYKDRHNRWIVEEGDKLYLTGLKDVTDAIAFYFNRKNPMSKGLPATKIVIDSN